LSLDQQSSNLFYQVISTRHSHKRSTIITNTAFSDWGNILYNTTIATAIADRLVENSASCWRQSSQGQSKSQSACWRIVGWQQASSAL
jgi:DNA replication protein DnaC